MAEGKDIVYSAFDVAQLTCPEDFGSGFKCFLTEFVDELKNPHLDDNILKAFTQVRSGCDITAVLLDSPALRPFLTLPAENSTYEDSAADALRESGNEHFKRSRFDAALKAYNNSILRCQREPCADHSISKCLPLSYANRSAVLYQLGELRGCLADIDAAIAAGYPADMAHKLHERKVRCLLRLHMYRAASEALTAARESLSACTLAEKEKQVITKLLDSHAQSCATAAETATSDAVARSWVEANSSVYPSAPPLSHGANDKYTALSAAVDVVENDRYGKHVVCKRKVAVGDIVAVDEPLVAVPLPTSLTTHCYFCLQRYGVAFYPCRRCSVALYCSQECESRSWSSYHRYECYKMLALTGCGHHLGHLALRATLIAGLIHHTSHTSPDTATVLQSAAKSQWCAQCPSDYDNILRQGIPTEAYSLPYVISFAILAVYLALCTNPDVAELIPSSALSGKTFLHHVAAITFTHLAAFLNRVHHIYETILSSTGGEPVRTAWAIYPVINLFNHSCDATVYRTYHKKKVALHSLRPLLPGDQVFDTYGPNYLDMTRHERRLRLQGFGFSCKCAACEGDWPTKAVLKRQFESEMLPPCVHRVGASGRDSRCLSCLVRFQSVITNSCGLAVGPESGHDLAIIKALTTALADLHRIAVPPHYLFVHCRDKLSFCFDLTGNTHSVVTRDNDGARVPVTRDKDGARAAIAKASTK